MSELALLEVVKDRISWDGNTWYPDHNRSTVVRCPECHTGLDSGDLGLLGATAIVDAYQ